MKGCSVGLFLVLFPLNVDEEARIDHHQGMHPFPSLLLSKPSFFILLIESSKFLFFFSVHPLYCSKGTCHLQLKLRRRDTQWPGLKFSLFNIIASVFIQFSSSFLSFSSFLNLFCRINVSGGMKMSQTRVTPIYLLPLRHNNIENKRYRYMLGDYTFKEVVHEQQGL